MKQKKKIKHHKKINTALLGKSASKSNTSDSAKTSKSDKKTKNKKKDIKKNQVNPDSFHARHPKFIKFFHILLFPIINPYMRWFLILLFVAALVGLFYLMKDLPSPRRLTSSENFAVSTQIFDRNGVLLYEVFGDENRIPVEYEEIPEHVIQATISIEDKNFYHHFGFDIEGIARAVRTNITGGRLEGGSTITQQLVKNALLTSERSMQRKVKEAILAVFTELLYSKEEIMEMYLNYISYGGTAVGIEAAANQYFDKSANELTLAEAALLAGLPQAPSTYSPFGANPEKAKNRQADVLNRMVAEGYISELEAENAKSEVLTFALSKTDIQAPHFVFYVKDILEEKYGEEMVHKGGLRVTTSLDLDLQEVTQASLSAEVDSLQRMRVGNGAAMVTKPNTGEILAMIGSKDYFDATAEGQVNVALAQRQPGSSIKPIMYATAFQEKKLNPGSILLDVPTCFKVPGQKDYCPKNYNGSFSGGVTVRNSIANSLNIPAVKALKLIGVETLMDQATKMGITSWTDPSRYGLSLTLGGGEVRMIDMAQAFGTLANQGVKVPLTPILKVEDYNGKIIDEIDLEERKEQLAELTEYDASETRGDLTRVMDRAPAFMTAHIMQDNKSRTPTFGSNSELVIPDQIVSAKTGTTNDLKDNWTVGFTPEFLVIAWVGNNDGSPMSRVASGVTGAAPIWNDIMSYVLEGNEPLAQEIPEDVVATGVCASGFPPHLTKKYLNFDCGIKHEDYFWRDSKPSESRMVKQQVWIKPETGQPPKEGESHDGMVLEEKTMYVDPLVENYCADCAQQVDPEGKIIHERIFIENSTTEESSQ